jgi:geranylgeranyl reductase family protein
MDWPDLAAYPNYGLVRKREDFDDVLAQQAVKAGARLYERCNVAGPILDEGTGRIIGVQAKLGEEKTPAAFYAPLVVAADGNSTRLSLAMGLHRREDRPMGVAVRTYFTSPRHEDDYLESWLELWDRRGPEPRQLPGYGWIFGLGDGTSNVGLGILNSSDAFRELDWREVLKAWVGSMPEDWGFTPENMTQPIRGAALPMAFNRQPHYTRGLLLVGDAGGMVNPFNGEGIAYAMESGQLAADVIAQAHARATAPQRELALARYPRILKDTYGGYYTLGRAFVKLIAHPKFLQLCSQHGRRRDGPHHQRPHQNHPAGLAGPGLSCGSGGQPPRRAGRVADPHRLVHAGRDCRAERTQRRGAGLLPPRDRRLHLIPQA